MKKGFLLFLCSLCYFVTFGQIPTLSFDNLESCNLKGKVKKIHTTSFLAEKVNNKFVKTTKGWQYTWEHDEEFKTYLTKVRAYAIDMETATIFTVGFYNKIPTGALLLVSDSPMVPEGVKTEASDSIVTAEFVDRHLSIGIESLKQLINDGLTVRHLQF